MKKLKCASFFAGVGGIDLGFESTDAFKVIYANEIDESAVKTYELNFDVRVDNRDIYDVNIDDIPDFDVLLAGFPCQAFSIAGYREGFNDRKGRGELFFQLEKIISVKKPKMIFLENVKNLVGHDNGKTFNTILKKLEALNCNIKYKVLNAMDYGNIPQNRERVYIVAFQDKNLFDKFKFPEPIVLTRKLKDVIQFDEKQDSKYYYTESSCNFYDKLKEYITNPDTIYQWRRIYVRANKSSVCPTLTANMGTGGHNVPLVLTQLGIRKLTPRECFNIQGYPKSFKLPDLANTTLYKQAGNSVAVPVIQRIAKQIKKIVKL